MESEVFLSLVERSRLISPERWSAFLAEYQHAKQSTPDHQWAALLVKDNLLTSFQAKQILKGKYKHFIISDKYKVLDQLDSGSNAAVFRCEHLALRRQVALKMVPGLKKDKVRAELFMKDARAAGVLNHPNILRVYDIDQFHGEFFLVQELVEGINLGRWVRKHGPLQVPNAVFYMAQAAQGLQSAFEAGWVHKCLTPRQLVVDKQGVVKILDYGLGALRLDDAVNNSTTQWAEKGDAARILDYLAPEQFLPEAAVDIRADVYALGCTMYYLLTARPPFAKFAIEHKAMAHQSKQPAPPRELNSFIPAGLEAVILKMLAKDPKERFQTPDEVIKQLAPYLPVNPQNLEPVTTSTTNPVYDSAIGQAVGMDSVTQHQSILKDSILPNADGEQTANYFPTFAGAEYNKVASSRWISRLMWLFAVVLVAAGLGLAYYYFIYDQPISIKLQQAQAFAQQQQWDKAIKDFGSLLDQSRRQRGQDPQSILLAVAEHGEVLTGLVAQRPRDIALQLFAAEHFKKHMLWGNARQCYENAYLAKPESFKTWNDWALCSVFTNEWLALAKALEAAADAKPDDPALAMQAGMAWLRTGNKDAFVSFHKRIWQRSQTSKQSQVWSAQFVFLWAWTPESIPPRKENYVKIREQLQPTLHVPWIRFGLAVCRFRNGEVNEAIAEMREARDVDFAWGSSAAYSGFMVLGFDKIRQQEPKQRALREWDGWYQRTWNEIKTTGQLPMNMPWWEWAGIQQLQAEITQSEPTPSAK